MVYADYIGKWWPGRENRGHSSLAIGHPLLPIVSPQRARRLGRTVSGRANADSPDGSLVVIRTRTAGGLSLVLAGGDPVQASEVVHAEVASRVLDPSLAPHLDQFGADHLLLGSNPRSPASYARRPRRRDFNLEADLPAMLVRGPGRSASPIWRPLPASLAPPRGLPRRRRPDPGR
jgi:hypothetical protein